MLYGFAAFETFRVEGGAIWHPSDHRERLEASARRLNLQGSVERLFEEAHEVASSLFPGPHVLRAAVVAGEREMGPWSRRRRGPDERWLWARQARSPASVRLRVVEATPGWGPSPWKTHAYAAPMGAQRSVSPEEALWVDARGLVLSAATANVFVVDGDRLLTPPLEHGIRDGVMRALLLKTERARASEARLTLGMLRVSDAIFTTSAARGISKVETLDGRPVGTSRGEELLRLLKSVHSSATAEQSPSDRRER
ncbi:MAG: hypothetical protein HC923_04515 [Myxococcales bacterium]|nr:hypothetical protein [Myxococcales bacterium]